MLNGHTGRVGGQRKWFSFSWEKSPQSDIVFRSIRIKKGLF